MTKLNLILPSDEIPKELLSENLQLTGRKIIKNHKNL